MIAEALLIVAAIGYLVASVFYGALLFKQHVNNRPSWLMLSRIFGGCGIAAHTGAIGMVCATTHQTPFTTPADSLSAMGWAVAGIYICTEILQYKKPPTALGAFAFPAAFLTLFAGMSLGAAAAHSTITKQLDTPLISLHVMSFLAAYGMFTLAACCGALYLIENRMLKRKQVASGLFSRLPPLATIDHMSFTLVSLALSLLTLGIATGAIRAFSMHQPLIDAQVCVTVLSWAIFGGYLLVHSSRQATGVRANYILFAGLAVSLLTFIIPSALHHFS